MSRTPIHPSGRHGRIVGLLLGAGGLVTSAVGPAAAHGTALEQFQAPVPLTFLLAGAAATVAITAALLARAGPVPDGQRPLVTLRATTADRLQTIARLGFLLLVAAAVLHGLVGRQSPTGNLATVVVWPIWLKGVAITAVLAGSPWRVLSPWRTLYAGLSRLEGRELGRRPLPAWLGVWPALVGFVALVGLAENLTGVPRSPAATAGLVAAYGGFVLAGSLVYGRAWFRRADPLEVFYRLLGRTAPLDVARSPGESITDADRRVRVRMQAPWRGSARPVAHHTLVAVVVAAVYTVSFDGFVETRAYQDLLFGARALAGTGSLTPALLYVAGLLAFLALFWAVAALTGRLGRFESPALALAATVVPIAAAYEVAHTYPFVLANLGQLPHVVGGPTIDLLGLLSLPTFWGSQVVLIVLGHLVAVVAAHQVVVRRVETDRRTLLAHAPLVALMVGYTILSLWIVSRPVVA